MLDCIECSVRFAKKKGEKRRERERERKKENDPS